MISNLCLKMNAKLGNENLHKIVFLSLISKYFKVGSTRSSPPRCVPRFSESRSCSWEQPSPTRPLVE